MKKSHLLLLASLLLPQSGFSQTSCPPAIEWQHLIGGTHYDSLSSAHQTKDGGFVLGGTSASGPGGSKTSPNFGSNDFWVVRLDHRSRKVWDRSFGGSDNDSLSVLHVTADGGFILGGTSASQPSGNKTSPNFGGNDFWVVRLNAAGKKLWEQSFGGSGEDYLAELDVTKDGGFILGGSSTSPPSGNKTSPKFGYVDFWIVRLDADGNKLWEETLDGGDSSSLQSLEQIADGGYILAGTGVTALSEAPWLDYHYWVVRLDSYGLRLWDRSHGGTGIATGIAYVSKVRQTKDGGFVLSGLSSSSFGFANGSPWILRLDAQGTEIWDTTFGDGERFEPATDLQETPDGGFIVAGSAGTWVVSTNAAVLSNTDGWLARLDFQGHLLWNESLGTTNSNEWISSLEPTSDGGFLLAGASDAASGIGDSISLPDAYDAWLVKLGPGDDCDHDGIPDPRDHCPDTEPGAAVDANGCSIAQLCPCEGLWKNHEEYVQRVAHVAAHFHKHGLISEEDMEKIVQTAERSDCGQHPHRHPNRE